LNSDIQDCQGVQGDGISSPNRRALARLGGIGKIGAAAHMGKAAV
jgi:hypothetical protein